MKPAIILLALLMGLTAFKAQAHETPTAKTIAFEGVFTSLVVNGNFKIVLTEGSSDKIMVEDAGAITASFESGVLSLSPRHPMATQPVTVHVPAAYLATIFLNDAAALSSDRALSNPKLRIVMDAEAVVNVRSNGKVAVETTDNVRFVKQ